MSRRQKILIIGDGPIGLTNAIKAVQAGHQVTLVGERDGQYSRKQIIRLYHSHMQHIARDVLGITNANTMVPHNLAQELSRKLRTYKGKQWGDQTYFTDNYADRQVENIPFTDEPFITFQIKHFEQLLYLHLNHLSRRANDTNSKTSRCRLIMQHRQRVPETGGKDTGAIQNIHANGTVTIGITDQYTNIKPDIIVVADGAASRTTGVMSLINRHISSQGQIQYVDGSASIVSTVNPANSVGTYNFPPENLTKIHLRLSNPEVSRDRQGLTPPSLVEYQELGWAHNRAIPEARIFLSKGCVYIGTETPQSILNVDNTTARRNQLTQWHRLVLRSKLPDEIVDSLYRKNQPTRPRTVSTADRMRRIKREQLAIAAFPVEVEHRPTISADSRLHVTLNETVVTPMGDALVLDTDYKTATGLETGLIEASRFWHQPDPASPAALDQYEKNIKERLIHKQQLNSKLANARQFESTGNDPTIHEGSVVIDPAVQAFFDERQRNSRSLTGGARSFWRNKRPTNTTLQDILNYARIPRRCGLFNRGHTGSATRKILRHMGVSKTHNELLARQIMTEWAQNKAEKSAKHAKYAKNIQELGF